MFVHNIVLIGFVISPAASSVVRNFASISTCRGSEFTCPDGTCIRAGAVCDTYWDCPDGSDEASCYSSTNSNLTEATASHARHKRQLPCGLNQWRCSDGTCIDVDCDGEIDCLVLHCGKVKTAESWKCVLPPYPEHGTYVAINAPNATPGQSYEQAQLNITCEQGYEVVGSSVVYCLDGIWVKPIPKCVWHSPAVSGKCVLPPYPEHGTYVAINAPNATPGQSLEYAQLNITCEQGYEVVGDAVPYCLDGTWFTPIQKCVSITPADPCLPSPSPCGPHASCRNEGGRAVCSCDPSKPFCRRSCQTNQDCPLELACNSLKRYCYDPCDKPCGYNIPCIVKNHRALCPSDEGYSDSIDVPQQPCNPSPCGPNAICRERNGTVSCTCADEFYGDPYSGCRPECYLDTDCSRDSSCFNHKCVDSCSGACGTNTECTVANHAPSCRCLPGYGGNPVYACIPVPSFCRLDPDVSVHYYCQVPETNGYRICNQSEPSGTLVNPKCNAPNYGSRDLLLSMTCGKDGKWNRIIKCKPVCGRVTPDAEGLIWGGTEAIRGELPWHVAIYRKPIQEKNYYEQICGGSLISNRIVISAAHCFWDKLKNEKQAASNFAVATAKLFREWDHKDDKDAQKSELNAIELSPYYQGVRTNFQHDIAVLILETPFVFYTYVRPVCLDFEKDFNQRQLQMGNFGKVAGWGLTGENGPSSPVLKVVELPFVPIQECIRITPQTFTENITGDKICAGYNNGTAALCKGDSGGGLSFPETERGTTRYYLRGVVSTAPRGSHECNIDAVTTFTEIYQHRDYIIRFL